MIALLSYAAQSSYYTLGNSRKLVPAILFSVLALLSHLWTWFIFTLAIVMILPTNFILNRLKLKRGFSKRHKIILVVFLLSYVLADLLRQFLFSSPPTLSLIYSAFRWGNKAGNIDRAYQIHF